MSIQLPYIQYLLDDPAVEKIMIDGWQHVYTEKANRFEDVPTPFANEEDLYGLIRAMAKALNVQVDEKKPLASFRMPDGTRVEMILPPISTVGPAVAILKVDRRQIQLEDLLRWGTLTQTAADFLKSCVEARLNTAITGYNASGRKTLLRIMARWIPLDERVLFLQHVMSDAGLPHPRLITLETRPPNAEGQGAVTMLDLVQGALRMRPDRILVDELLGAETYELVSAMIRGQDGCLFAVNAISPRDALSRLERLNALGYPELPLAAIREQIAAALDLIVHLEQMLDGSRKVVNISEVQGFDNGVIVMADIFLFEQTGYVDGIVEGSLRPTGTIPLFLDKLNRAGVQLPVSMFTPGTG
jgi:pilus assembly protein CpaF